MESRVQEQLEWEARQRPRAGLAAILAAALTIGGSILSRLPYSDVPRASVLDALDRAAQPGPIGTQPSLRVPLYEWFTQNTGQFVTASVISAFGALATGALLTFLAFTVGARRAQFPRVGLYVPIVGSVLMAIALILVAVGTGKTVDDVLAGPRTVDGIADVKASTLLATGQIVELVGRFALGAGFILVGLNAMRAGLLTRFMGVLGIIAGVLLVLPVFGGPFPVVQTLWLFAVGLLLLGRWPGGEPEAWRTGTEVPWPSNAELREARLRQSEPAPEPKPERTTDRPSPATSAKKKRKRRG